MKPAKHIQSSYGAHVSSEPVDEAKQRELAIRFLPVVKNELSRLRMRIPGHVDVEELHGVAIAGMMRALTKWTPDSEATFGAYLRQRVRGALLDELRRMDVFTRSARKKAKEYDEVVLRLEQELKRPASEEELREALDLSKGEFEDLMEELRPISFLSLDAPLADAEPSGSLSDVLDDPNESNARDVTEMKDIASRVHERMSHLPENQKRILHLYYFKELRLSEIAAVFEVSESRICQLHTQAIRSLQAGIQEDLT